MGFFRGLLSPFEAMRFLCNNYKGMRRYIIAPFILSLSFILLMIFFLYGFIEQQMHHLHAYLWSSLVFVLEFFTWAIVGLISYYIYSLLVMVIASPFNDMLCVKVLKLRGIDVDEPPLIKGMFRAVFDALKLLVLKLFLMIMSLIISPLAFVVLCLIVGLDYFDFPWSYKTHGLFRKLKLIMDSPGAFAGFCLSYGLILAIPFLGVMMMPFAVISAALLVKEKGFKGG